MNWLREVFPVDEDAEITIEANPGDLSDSLCHSLLSAGINRISFGIQSLDDNLLAMLGRRHSAQQAADAFTTAASCGFSNANLDLIYGLPGQTMGTMVHVGGGHRQSRSCSHLAVLFDTGGWNPHAGVGAER